MFTVPQDPSHAIDVDMEDKIKVYFVFSADDGVTHDLLR